MKFNNFKGQGPIVQAELPRPDQAIEKALTDPAGYVAGPALRNAVNVALTLGRPLLLTGDPGTGKTQLAYRLAAELGLGEPLRFDTKSSSVATELFYQFDSVGQFARGQLAALREREPPPAAEFIRYRALGEAILRTLPWATVAGLVSPAQATRLNPDPSVKPYEPRVSVVLIDEVDKAPRDFPNDLLNQIENLEFAIPELEEERIQADKNLRPIIVITSNSEKQLPEAFLRRCVYHHIEFPRDPDSRRREIQDILDRRLEGYVAPSGPAYEEALETYFRLHDNPSTEKRPSTSELLDWLRALREWGVDWQAPFADQQEIVRACIGTLAKNHEDMGLLSKQLGLD